jgi:two-component system, OmpR family, aerobic respiration control sensor histidine kinase ArcB
MNHDRSVTPTREIDTAPLHRLLQLAGKRDAPTLIAALLTDLKTTQTGLDVAWNGPDFAALRTHSHVLIALAGTIGDTDLQALAQRLNETAHAQNTANLLDMKAKTTRYLTDLISTLLCIQSAGA